MNLDVYLSKERASIVINLKAKIRVIFSRKERQAGPRPSDGTCFIPQPVGMGWGMYITTHDASRYLMDTPIRIPWEASNADHDTHDKRWRLDGCDR